ncbi:hypothetical protein FRC10_001188 [Ceratobasidium sp. 414]|nr:hypothetical protein FRC10_001188 [Ceratobasidium sp. 414]
MRVLVAVAAVTRLSAAAVDIRTIRYSSTGNIVPDSYIVELKQGLHLKRGFASPHAELYHDLERRGAKWEATKEYLDPIFTGASVTLGSQADLPKLAWAPGVELTYQLQAIYPIYIRAPPTPVSSVVVAPSDVRPGVVDTFSTHAMTGVDRLHGQGYFGKDITIGIIDTGVDYTHPALGGKFGPGNKIVGGYDFVKHDGDPLDQCNGHGTHVAGIIGANPGSSFDISGVAYEATLNAYRIFDCKGGASDAVIVEALVRANRDGNDIITLSLGGANGWTEGVPSVVASRIARTGRIVTVAAGNDGEFGSWYASTPATGLDVISVGSVDNSIMNAQKATLSIGRQITYNSLLPLNIPGNLPIFATSLDTTVAADACDPLPPATPDLSNHLVLIRRGTCAFTQKMGNAAAFGAKYFLIYDNKDQPFGGIDVDKYTAALISQADGIYLVNDAISAKATISFLNNPYVSPFSGGGLVSDFSTYGPSNDMYLNPAVLAPGGRIVSTYPVPMGSYALDSGTSMATPFMAGACALWLQVRGKTAQNAQSARAAFENTAKLVPLSYTDGSLLETAAHAGAGLIQVYDAIYSKGSMLPAELLLNDTANFKGEHSVTITNGGAEAVTYTLTHVPAGTAPTINGIENLAGPVKLVNKFASVTIAPSGVTVQPGSSTKIAVSFTAPAGLDAKTFPVYSGFIQAKGSDGSSLHSTYLGVAAALKDMKVIDNTDLYFGVKLPHVKDGKGKPIDTTTTYLMEGDDMPKLVYRLVAGSPLVRIDLIDSGTNDTTNQCRSIGIQDEDEDEAEGTKHVLPFASVSKRGSKDRLVRSGAKIKRVSIQVRTLGTLYEKDYVSRNSLSKDAEKPGFSTFVVEKFKNGTAIPNGRYKILFKAAKITSDVELEESYEVWASPEIVIKRA